MCVWVGGGGPPAAWLHCLQEQGEKKVTWKDGDGLLASKAECKSQLMMHIARKLQRRGRRTEDTVQTRWLASIVSSSFFSLRHAGLGFYPHGDHFKVCGRKKSYARLILHMITSYLRCLSNCEPERFQVSGERTRGADRRG